MKDVTTFAAGENLIIGQVSDQILAYGNVKLLAEYTVAKNVTHEFTKIVITTSKQQVFVTFFYKSADDLHMKTMSTEFEDVYGMIRVYVSVTSGFLTTTCFFQNHFLVKVQM